MTEKLSLQNNKPETVTTTVVMDADEAVRKLTTKYDMPPKAKKMFGPLNIKALYEMMNDPAMLQIDALVQRGELTHREAYEYILVLPEYDNLRLKILALAKNLVAVLKNSKAIRSAVRKSAPTLQTARPGRGFKPGKELDELMFEILDFCKSQQVKGLDTFRNGWLLHLQKSAFDLLAMEIILECRKKDYASYDRKFIDDIYFKRWQEISSNGIHIYFGGDRLKQYKEHLEKMIKSNRDSFAAMLGEHEAKCNGGGRCTDEWLTEENRMLFAEINDQTQGKKIHEASKKTGVCMLEVPLDLSDSKHQEILTVVTLHFGDASEYKKIKFGELDECGIKRYSQTISPNSFELTIDRSTGDLCYPLTRIPVSHSMDSRQYGVLKNLVLSFLLDNLEGRLEPVERRVDGTRSELCDCLDGQGSAVLDERSGFEEEREGNVCKYPSVHPPADIEDTRTEEEKWDEEWKICRYRARGKNGRIILAAIKRILKREPIRIMGSHQVFEGDNGKRCPVPIHPSSTMALGSLKNFLITLEISPLALAEEL